MGWGIWHVLGDIRNVYYIPVNKNMKGNDDLEDLSVDVKIYKIYLVKFRRKIQVWYNKGTTELHSFYVLKQ